MSIYINAESQKAAHYAKGNAFPVRNAFSGYFVQRTKIP
jgi:hypothetical protein